MEPQTSIPQPVSHSDQPVTIVPSNNTPRDHSKDLTLEQLLYVIGASLIIFASFGFAFVNWNNLSPIIRILAVLFGIVLVYGMGFFVKLYSKIDRLDTVLFFFGTLLTPVLFLAILTNGYTAHLSMTEYELVGFVVWTMGAIWATAFYLVHPRQGLSIIWPIYWLFAGWAFAIFIHFNTSYSFYLVAIIVSIIYLAVTYLSRRDELKNVLILKKSLGHPEHAKLINVISSFILLPAIAFFCVGFSSDTNAFIRLLPAVTLLGILMWAVSVKNSFWTFMSLVFLVLTLFINLPYVLSSLEWPVVFAIVGVAIVAAGVFISSFKKRKLVNAS